MTLIQYLKAQGLDIEIEEIPGMTVHNVYPNKFSIKTDYVDEIIERGRPDIEALIGSGIICWNDHVIAGMKDANQLASQSRIGSYHHLHEDFYLNRDDNFSEDFWHRDALVDGLISLHHPSQSYPRISNTLFIGKKEFETGFFQALKALTVDKRNEVAEFLKSGPASLYPDLLESADREDESFFENALIVYILRNFQKALPFFADILDAQLKPYVVRERWKTMNRTVTIHNDHTWHKRAHLKEVRHDKAGVLLRRHYEGD